MIPPSPLLLGALLLAPLAPIARPAGPGGPGGTNAGEITGELRTWHKLEITFQHDQPLSEQGAENPFRDYRLDVTFEHVASGARVVVPGFFAADGEAADTSAEAGTCWAVRFSPDRPGEWLYTASFRTGVDVAMDFAAEVGVPISFDGAGGAFVVQPTDPSAPGFLSRGRLVADGTHHLVFAETGEHFLKGGADSPENLLAYHEFDQTFDTGGVPNDLDTSLYADGLHHFDAHAGDFKTGDPTWLGGGTAPRGQNLIGALNYLAGKGMNSVYFLTYNIDGGDGHEVWPWTSPQARYRFDVSKLAQWEVVFEHMTRAGLALHVITQETENDQALGGGGLSPIRRLYYRELVARFAHHPALFWNLGEENTNTPTQRQEFAKALRDLDPYDHPITVHSYPGQQDAVFGSLLGFQGFDGPSLQLPLDQVHAETMEWIDRSAAAGRPWFVCNDEQTPAGHGVVPDGVDGDHAAVRKQALWGNLMAQGSGCEWYFGYQFPHNDLDCEDWRSRDVMWDQTRHALEFFRNELPFAEMKHADGLTPDPGDYVLAKNGSIYAIYRPEGGATTLNLGANASTFTVEWFDARDGGPLQVGSVSSVSGPGQVDIGAPPVGGDDWTAVVRNASPLSPSIREARLERGRLDGVSDTTIRVWVTDPTGPSDLVGVDVYVMAPDGNWSGPVPLQHDGGDSWSLFIEDAPPMAPGIWTWGAVALDRSGSQATVVATLSVP